jgi:hypothetical protein
MHLLALEFLMNFDTLERLHKLRFSEVVLVLAIKWPTKRMVLGLMVEAVREGETTD